MGELAVHAPQRRDDVDVVVGVAERDPSAPGRVAFRGDSRRMTSSDKGKCGLTD
ncbi:hypothetical protein [Actinomadura sp. 1N219]|uniref:hypothetical protein n=1 Tax=Actinomadura sp. 1N219 TaxID=3375152 RepID=UPI0037C02B09